MINTGINVNDGAFDMRAYNKTYSSKVVAIP